MASIENDKLTVISERDDADLSAASLDENLSAVNFDDDGKFFYMTIDRALFTNPVTTIRKVLDAHGYVSNLENVLSCLDSFNFSVHTQKDSKDGASPVKIQEYMPCIRFELPQKTSVGPILKSFYDEIAKYEAKAADATSKAWSPDLEIKKNSNVKVEALKAENKELTEQVRELTYQLSIEQKSLSRASRALDSQRMLPDNAKICRVDRVDLMGRKIQVKNNRKTIDIATHLLDRVPKVKARCLITFDEHDDAPLGVIFFDSEELGDLEKRTADVLFVSGNAFKARDSMRNEFQISAVNETEVETITSMTRGMKVVISLYNGFVVRFSVLGSISPERFRNQVHEQFIVHDIARNQLIARFESNHQD
jgi:hypothetical protein